MFESFPLLYGERLTYHEYMPVLFATTSMLTAAMVLLLHVALRVALRRDLLTLAMVADTAEQRLGGDACAPLALEMSALSTDVTEEQQQTESSSPLARTDPDKQRCEAWVVSLLGLGAVFIIWFVWTLEAFGTMGWGLFIFCIFAVLVVLGAWPFLVSRCRRGGARAAPQEYYYPVLMQLTPWFAACAASFGLLQPSVWGFVPLAVGALMGAVPHWLWLLHPPPRRRRAVLIMVACLCWSSCWAYLLEGMCVGYYQPDEPGVPIFGHLGPVHISTRTSRNWLAPRCGKDREGDRSVCHLYLTAAEDLSTQVYVNAHVKIGAPPLAVCYDVDTDPAVAVEGEDASADTETCVPMQEYGMPSDTESAAQRSIRAALLQRLYPGTKYRFRLLEQANNDPGQRLQWSTARRFRTVTGSVQLGTDMPPIRFVVGGDSGSTAASRMMMRAAAARSPDFAVHGGDFAYGQALSSCCRLWDNFLTDWAEISLAFRVGYLHIVGCWTEQVIGNHDAGTNHNAAHSFLISGDEDPALPPMLRYFPHEVSESFPHEVPPSRRRTYHKHTAAGGAVTLVGLDSGYVAAVDGAQQAWLAAALQSPEQHREHRGRGEGEGEGGGDLVKKSRWRFAVYHVPLYASTGHWEDDDLQAENVLARQAWVPQFDAANLDASFEHHVHTMKRTRPMRGSEYHPYGTTYLGDGSWGVERLGGPSMSDLNATRVDSSTGTMPEDEKAQANLASVRIATHVWECEVGIAEGGRSIVRAIGYSASTSDNDGSGTASVRGIVLDEAVV